MFGDGSDDDGQRRRFTRRAALLGIGQLGAFGLIGTQLFRLQVLEASRYAPLAEENRVNAQVLAPQRGRILDRHGEVLAANQEAYRAVLTPALSDDVGRVVARLSEIVPIATAMQERIVQRARRQPAQVPIVLAGDLDFEQIARINLMAP
jgi:penicillin-binding protein 2